MSEVLLWPLHACTWACVPYLYRKINKITKPPFKGKPCLASISLTPPQYFIGRMYSNLSFSNVFLCSEISYIRCGVGPTQLLLEPQYPVLEGTLAVRITPVPPGHENCLPSHLQACTEIPRGWGPLRHREPRASDDCVLPN